MREINNTIMEHPPHKGPSKPPLPIGIWYPFRHITIKQSLNSFRKTPPPKTRSENRPPLKIVSENVYPLKPNHEYIPYRHLHPTGYRATIWWGVLMKIEEKKLSVVLIPHRPIITFSLNCLSLTNIYPMIIQ